ncbi:MAG: DUF393 domain-containing protein [Proteobacteria bacterium]|nr:DUF393 domain-containing protein [Pseudomonadota bacterium]
MTETNVQIPKNPGAWAFYDHRCPVCRATIGRWRRVFEARRIEFAALQSPWVRERLGLAPGELPDEMKLLTPDGRILGGPVAIAWMCRRVLWLWPLGAPSSRLHDTGLAGRSLAVDRLGTARDRPSVTVKESSFSVAKPGT